MSLNGDERETTINMSDGDETVRIWSAQRAVINALRKRPQFTEISSGVIGTTEWASFTIPRDQWNPASGVKRKRKMTDEQRRIAGERLRKYRETEIQSD